MGIGTRRDPLEANVWYVKAAASGDERANFRLAAIREAASGGGAAAGRGVQGGGVPMEVAPPKNAKLNGAKIKKNAGVGEGDVLNGSGKGEKEKDCRIM